MAAGHGPHQPRPGPSRSPPRSRAEPWPGVLRRRETRARGGTRRPALSRLPPRGGAAQGARCPPIERVQAARTRARAVLWCFYSFLSAIIGSSRVARRTGIHEATTATSRRPPAAAAKVGGSPGVTPNNSPLSTRVAATAPAVPAAMPIAAIRRLCATIRRRMPWGDAPMAKRIPISCVRCATVWDTTP